jgi:hypothetical protein
MLVILFDDEYAPQQCAGESIVSLSWKRARTCCRKRREKRDVLHEECSKPPTHFASGAGNHDDCGRPLLVSFVDAGPGVRDLGHSDGVDRIHWILPDVFDRKQDQPTEMSQTVRRARTEKALEEGPACSDSAANLRGNLNNV